MEGRNKARGSILKMPGPSFMVAAFDQDGFDRQQVPLQDGTMHGVKTPFFRPSPISMTRCPVGARHVFKRCNPPAFAGENPVGSWPVRNRWDGLSTDALANRADAKRSGRRSGPARATTTDQNPYEDLGLHTRRENQSRPRGSCRSLPSDQGQTVV